MLRIKQFNLLEEVKRRHPDGIIKGRKNVTLFELGDKNFKTPETVELLLAHWQPVKGDLCTISLRGIDVLVPSVAKVLVGAARNIAESKRMPLVFTDASETAIEDLDSCARSWHSGKIILVVDENGKTRLIGCSSLLERELIGLFESWHESLKQLEKKCESPSLLYAAELSTELSFTMDSSVKLLKECLSDCRKSLKEKDETIARLTALVGEPPDAYSAVLGGRQRISSKLIAEHSSQPK